MRRTDPCRDFRFPEEALNQFGLLLRQVEGQHLDGDTFFQARMNAIVYCPHAALAQLCQQGNAAERGPLGAVKLRTRRPDERPAL